MNRYNYNTIRSMFTKRYFLFIISVFLISCQSDDDQSPIEQAIHGFWFAEDKGYIIELSDDKNVLYNISAAGCTILNDDFKPEELAGLRLEEVSANELLGTSDLFEVEINFVRLPNQHDHCLPDQIANTKDPKINYDYFWNIFNDYYAFFEKRNVNWGDFKNLGDQVTEDNFYDVIEELVLKLKDGHVSLNDEDNNIEIESGFPSLIERLNTNLQGDLIIKDIDDYWGTLETKNNIIAEKYMVGELFQNDGGNMFWGLVTDDIGYVVINDMEDFGSSFENEISALNETLDDVMNTIKEWGVSKLIIDIRFNGGGHGKVSMDIASRFVNRELPVYSYKARLGDSYTTPQTISIGPKGDFQFTDDIVLLTSPVTASAAESFVLCLKDLSYVTIVGENTRGIFSTELTHSLPNGATVVLSNEVYSDVEGTVFEAIGIGPDNEENRIPVFSYEDFSEEKDSGIERAIELLRN